MDAKGISFEHVELPWEKETELSIRPLDTATEVYEQPTNSQKDDAFQQQKAEEIVAYLVDCISNVDYDDFTAEEILDYLDGDDSETIATNILDFVQEENSRADYDDDDVYEIARIVRKRKM